MTRYWIRHRLLFSFLFDVTVALVSVLLVVYPFINQQADMYNSQSIYKNTDIDFIAPEPSFEQINELSGVHGIDKVFPFFLTKTSVTVNGVSRTTTILLSDRLDNVDITMYNSSRIIKKSSLEYNNSILVDWQFCHDTSADIGDTVFFSIGGTNAEYKIYAIYETNNIYEGGAILAQLNTEQKDLIVQNAQNNGYSGMYVSASNYAVCQTYMTKDYRPLGRLKARKQFASDEQYQVHYDAIMSSGYTNEITDFRVRENSLDKKASVLMIWLGAGIFAVIVIVYNVIMSSRGCEKGYFTKHCIPKGQNVKPYYVYSFICELLVFAVAYAIILFYKVKSSSDYIPNTMIGVEVAVIPAVVLIAELLSFIMNKFMVKGINQN
ncbi:MAG: hypothetical protein NC253_04185 [Ruminococcus sp.]|nr:hypothetical protein [Ruminococcus sp.]MCM1381450.1 hypothetical protein [Muribaculaceae bacterium]MCM1479680.1 hypothetical protein [Muribaculaceae bacterium]